MHIQLCAEEIILTILIEIKLKMCKFTQSELDRKLLENMKFKQRRACHHTQWLWH